MYSGLVIETVAKTLELKITWDWLLINDIEIAKVITFISDVLENDSYGPDAHKLALELRANMQKQIPEYMI